MKMPLAISATFPSSSRFATPFTTTVSSSAAAGGTPSDGVTSAGVASEPFEFAFGSTEPKCVFRHIQPGLWYATWPPTWLLVLVRTISSGAIFPPPCMILPALATRGGNETVSDTSY